MSCLAEIHPVPYWRVEETWPVVSSVLSPAIERSQGRYSLGSVLDFLLKRDMQLWVIRRGSVIGAVVTEIRVYPTGLKAVAVVLLAGEDFDSWFPLWRYIEKWALANGCSLAEMVGRRGWEKKLGWQLTAVEMVKEI